MAEAVYLNQWYKNGKGYGPEFYTPEKFVKEYKAFKIYYRAGCFDVVLHSVCITQTHGLNGAKRWIDSQ